VILSRAGGESAREDSTAILPPRALYLHMPLCASKCGYCDFFSVPAAILPRDGELQLVDSILDRAGELLRRFGSDRVDTIYVGGGTPTVLPPQVLDRLLAGAGKLAMDRRGARPEEWTVEANPDSLGPESLAVMAARGVTRISIGVQSLEPAELATLARRHSPEAALSAVSAAAAAGFSVSVDLMAGLPWPRGELPNTPQRLDRFARELIEAGATHLSIYDLTLEEGTPLARRASELDFPGESLVCEARQALEAELSAAGMRRYEVSNYAAPGGECLHNLAYWRMDSYVGAGPSAVSTIRLAGGGSLRIEEARDLEAYSGAAAVETAIDPKDAMFETIMMAFRTSFGLDEVAFLQRFGVEAASLIGATLSAWAERIGPGEPWPGFESSQGSARGVARRVARRVALDGLGLDLLNRFLCECLIEMERAPATAVLHGA